MINLLKWLDRREIAYRRQEPWALIFSGNHTDGVLISADHIDAIRRYHKRNRNFSYEWRGNYSTLYLYPDEEVAL